MGHAGMASEFVVISKGNNFTVNATSIDGQ